MKKFSTFSKALRLDKIVLTAAFCIFLLAACLPNKSNLSTPIVPVPEKTEIVNADLSTPPATAIKQTPENLPDTFTLTVPENARHIFHPPLQALGPEAFEVEFMTEDGRSIEGLFYPGAYEQGPVIILIHWAIGNMHDWDVIAPWLQNRNLKPLGGSDRQSANWYQSEWFPALPEWSSFSVLVFNYGYFGKSEGSYQTRTLDVKAAIDFVSALPYVNPDLIVTAGASLGADGAPDGCYLHQLDPGSTGLCLGAFSLSPGDYLIHPEIYPYSYAQTIEALIASETSEKIVYCLAAENDENSPDTCRSGQTSTPDLNRFKFFLYSGKDHGLELLEPELFPIDPHVDLNALEIFIQFLEESYKIDLAKNHQ